jgi:hypothetical protein
MTDWKTIVSRFERQLDNPDLTDGERAAIEHRIKWIEMLNRQKPSRTETTFCDPVYARLTEDGYSLTPASLLKG